MSSVKLDKDENDIPVKDEETPNEETEDENDIPVKDEETPNEETEDEKTEDEKTATEDEKTATTDEETEDEKTEDDSDEEDEDFKKFEQDIKKDILLDFHPQIKQISHKEMLTLCKIVRNKNGQIIDSLHKTVPFLTKFEKARIIGLRAKQINNGCEPFVDVPPNMIEGLTIAEKELQEKNVPFIIRRPLPNGASEYWKVNDLEIL